MSTIIILTSLVFGILLIVSMRPKKLNQTKDFNTGEYLSTKQFFEVIDLMRDKNIITNQEHIQLIVKMNPYLK